MAKFSFPPAPCSMCHGTLWSNKFTEIIIFCNYLILFMSLLHFFYNKITNLLFFTLVIFALLYNIYNVLETLNVMRGCRNTHARWRPGDEKGRGRNFF